METIEFLDVTHVRRRMSVDFTVPQDKRLPTKLSTGQELVFVPLAFLAKRVLKNFDVRDEANTALPLLTQQQNTAIGHAILTLAARVILAEQLDEHVARDLEDVVGGSAGSADKALANLRGPMGAGSHDQRERLMRNAIFRTLAADLAFQFVLYVPLSSRPGDRRVLKFQYDEDFRRGDLTLAGRLGLSPVPFNFLAPSLGAAESYHVEVPSPDEDLVIASASLSQLRENAKPLVLDNETVVHRTHLHKAGLPRGALGWVDVRFRLRRAGFVVAAFILALITTGLLSTGWFLHHYDVPSSPGIASALLVALPGVYAAYLARPGEHRMLKMLVSWIRALVVGLAGLSFIAAGALAIGISGSRRAWVWGVGALLAASATLLIGLALGASKWRDSRRGRTN